MTDSHSNGQLEKVGRADKCGGRGHIEGKPPQIRPCVGDKENAVALNQQWHGNQANDKRLVEIGLRLKAKQQHDCRQ